MKYHYMNRLATLGLLCGSLTLAGCAATKVEFTGDVSASPSTVCKDPGDTRSALVLWRTNWRPDQKDVAQREEAIVLGLKDFLSKSACFSSHQLKRLPSTEDKHQHSEAELLVYATNAYPRADRVIVVTVKELGPIVRLFSSAAVIEGGTEVKMDVSIFNANTATPMANFQTHWQNGGALVVKGVSSLPQDMSDAMKAAIAPN